MKLSINFFGSSKFLALVAVGVLTACNGGNEKFSKSGEGIVRPLADDTVILEYKGGKITAKDVNLFTKSLSG